LFILCLDFPSDPYVRQRLARDSCLCFLMQGLRCSALGANALKLPQQTYEFAVSIRPDQSRIDASSSFISHEKELGRPPLWLNIGKHPRQTPVLPPKHAQHRPSGAEPRAGCLPRKCRRREHICRGMAGSESRAQDAIVRLKCPAQGRPRLDELPKCH